MNYKIASILLSVILLFLTACVGKKQFAPEANWSIEADRNTRKVIWYKITQPVKNTGQGTLYLKMENGKYDTSSMNVSQLSLSAVLLESGTAYFNDSTKHIIVLKETIKSPDSLQAYVNRLNQKTFLK